LEKKKTYFFQKRLNEAIGERMQDGGSDGYIIRALDRMPDGAGDCCSDD